MKHTIVLMLLMMTPCLTLAQKTKVRTIRQELGQARTYIKPRTKNYGQAEQLMNKLLADSANRGNKDIQQVLFEAVRGQYDQANERMYLKQQQDTAAFLNLARRMFSIAFTLDSIDMRPDHKGRVAPSYRQKHATLLSNYRPNLFYGGTFFVRKNKWQEAYNFMETYIDCARQPLFANYDYQHKDQRLPEAAYWATYSGYKLKDAAKTLRYQKLAQEDSTHMAYALQFAAEAQQWQNDQEQYIATLETGFRHDPMFPYFFPRLMDAYTNGQQYDKALALADTALQVCDSCELFLFAKSSVLLRLERWEESIRYSRMAMQQNDSLPEPYFNAGMAYMKMADQLNATDDKKLYRDHYQHARTYMEYYRLLMPKEQEKWGPALYRIYLNLNLGKQFDEIDRLLKKR